MLEGLRDSETDDLVLVTHPYKSTSEPVD